MVMDSLYKLICHRRIIGGFVGVLVVVILLSMMTLSYWQYESPVTGPQPQLIIDDSVASDFETLAEETWDKFLAAFQARSNCFGDVHLRAARTLGSRAAYDPDSATVTVRVPGTPAMLRGALIHEWAHHLEFQCEAQKDLRPAFLAAQRLPAYTPWRSDRTPAYTPVRAWAETPSEQFAEATIEYVLGQRHIPTEVRVTREAVQAIATWAVGDQVSAE